MNNLIIALIMSIAVASIVILIVSIQDKLAHRRALSSLTSLFKKYAPKSSDEYEHELAYGESLLDEYKNSQQLCLIVNGKVVARMTIAQAEAAAEMRGVSSETIGFEVNLNSDMESGESVLKFPQN